MPTKAELQDQVDGWTAAVDAVVDILSDANLDPEDRIDMALDRLQIEVVEAEEEDEEEDEDEEWDDED